LGGWQRFENVKGKYLFVRTTTGMTMRAVSIACLVALVGAQSFSYDDGSYGSASFGSAELLNADGSFSYDSYGSASFGSAELLNADGSFSYDSFGSILDSYGSAAVLNVDGEADLKTDLQMAAVAHTSVSKSTTETVTKTAGVTIAGAAVLCGVVLASVVALVLKRQTVLSMGDSTPVSDGASCQSPITADTEVVGDAISFV
jgi:hypothetical protein